MTICKKCNEDIDTDRVDQHRRACSQPFLTVHLFDVTSRTGTGKYPRKIYRQPDGKFYCPTLDCDHNQAISNSFSKHVRQCDDRVSTRITHQNFF